MNPVIVHIDVSRADSILVLRTRATKIEKAARVDAPAVVRPIIENNLARRIKTSRKPYLNVQDSGTNSRRYITTNPIAVTADAHGSITIRLHPYVTGARGPAFVQVASRYGFKTIREALWCRPTPTIRGRRVRNPDHTGMTTTAGATYKTMDLSAEHYSSVRYRVNINDKTLPVWWAKEHAQLTHQTYDMSDQKIRLELVMRPAVRESMEEASRQVKITLTRELKDTRGPHRSFGFGNSGTPI